jgi:hypothetical protein
MVSLTILSDMYCGSRNNNVLESERQQTSNLHVQGNGSAINLNVSSHERTFSWRHCSTVTRYLRQQQLPALYSKTPDEPPIRIIDEATLDALHKQLFSSIGEVAKVTCIPTTPAPAKLQPPAKRQPRDNQKCPANFSNGETQPPPFPAAPIEYHRDTPQCEAYPA